MFSSITLLSVTTYTRNTMADEQSSDTDRDPEQQPSVGSDPEQEPQTGASRKKGVAPDPEKVREHEEERERSDEAEGRSGAATGS